MVYVENKVVKIFLYYMWVGKYLQYLIKKKICGKILIFKINRTDIIYKNDTKYLNIDKIFENYF